jgi:ABC-type transport system involved in multi-copper enzyme maturation permease subunit
VTAVRVELRRLLARRAVRALWVTFLALICLIVLINYLHASSGEPLTAAFVRDGGVGVGAGFAVLAFLVGATAGGAEWAARTVEALLLWEPRRTRVMAAKIAALAATAAVAAVFVQLVVAGLSRAAVAGRGSMAGAGDHFWRDYVGNGATVVALAVLAALLGFAISSLTRNTGVALGVAFVYFVIIDQVLRVLFDWIEPYTLVSNIGAFVDHGLEIAQSDGTVMTLTTARAGVTLVIYVGAVLGVAITLFRRRDVT